MAFWDKISSRGHVEDRRGFSPAVGGIGITGVAFVLLVSYLTGSNPVDLLSQLQTIPLENTVRVTDEFEGEDEYERFASQVLGSNNQMWQEQFQQLNKNYTAPTLVLFRTATTSGCGTATSQVGPHYCPLDKTIYLDETFFDELTNRFGAQGGDVAEAYVIAHEVGHHVQNELGTIDTLPQTQEAAIALELQADCFAGLWVHSIKNLGVLEPGEVMEAIDAAAAVGDDRIQEKVTGYVNPETWTHGSSAQRKQWFNTGYEQGTVASCDTF